MKKLLFGHAVTACGGWRTAQPLCNGFVGVAAATKAFGVLLLGQGDAVDDHQWNGEQSQHRGQKASDGCHGDEW